MTQLLTEEAGYAALRNVIDPELYQNIVDLGLVYGVEVLAGNDVLVTMTLTTPHCPMGPQIVENVGSVLYEAGATAVKVKIVWDPPWTPAMMTDELRRELGILTRASKRNLSATLAWTPPPSAAQEKRAAGLAVQVARRLTRSHMAPKSFAFEQPGWRKAQTPGMGLGVLLFGTLLWVLLYMGLGWRFWPRGFHLGNPVDLWLLFVSIALGAGVVLGWRAAWPGFLSRWRCWIASALSLAEMQALSPSAFEAYVGERLFARKGYHVHNTRDVKDGGIDLLVTDRIGQRAVVQCKRYRGR